MPAQIIPVIMCGGAGTRLWPVSRESMPKQFVPLVGQGTMFQQVLESSASTHSNVLGLMNERLMQLVDLMTEGVPTDGVAG